MQLMWKIASVLFTIAIFPSGPKAMSQSSAYYVKAVAHKAAVDILIVSSSVHINSGSQEIYLANVSFQNGTSHLAKLIDRYSSTGYPVRHVLLREHRILKMQLVRNEQCDVKKHEFFLPNDPEMFFDANVRAELKEYAEEMIPCYTVVHNATRLAKP